MTPAEIQIMQPYGLNCYQTARAVERRTVQEWTLLLTKEA